MRVIILLLLLLPSVFCYSQLDNPSVYSKDVCHCLDSVGDVEKNFPDCLQFAIDRHRKELQDSTEYTDSLTQALMLNLEVNLITNCPTFFKFTDSAIQAAFQKSAVSNKDSLRHLLSITDTIPVLRRDSGYYGIRATIYYNLGQYQTALNEIDQYLIKVPNSAMGLFLKGKLLDLMGNYSDAVPLYDRVAEMTNNKAVLIYSAIARQKAKAK